MNTASISKFTLLESFALIVSCYYFLDAAVVAADGSSSGLTSDVDWWKHTIIYQIYPRSFKDSNGDGVGDIKGITSQLDHFKLIHVDTIWLSPIYKSPMVDHGYDVEDYTDIDPTFGTLADFDELVKQAHKRGIRVLMDFIPNHTSNKHKWFVESQKGGDDNEYSNYYIWTDGKLQENGERVIPNNWRLTRQRRWRLVSNSRVIFLVDSQRVFAIKRGLTNAILFVDYVQERSCFTGPAWTWNTVRNQFYFHQFCPEQPDLNYRNPAVRSEMQKVLQFWLDRGVDGFRVDAIATLFESEDLSLDEPRSMLEGVQPHEEFYLDHKYTRSLPEIHDVVREWRQLFDRHYEKTGRYTFMMTEVYETVDKAIEYYHSGADMPLNMLLINGKQDCYARCYQDLIQQWLSAMPAGKWPNFVIGNHDRSRVSVRKGRQYVNAMNVLLLTLPGTPTTYYGEEIGMNEINVTYEDTQDPWGKNLGPELYMTASRDPGRSPMQWDRTANAGFSTAQKTWLPVHPDHVVFNVMLQQTYAHAPLVIYQRVAQLRKGSSFRTEHIRFLPGDDNIIAYIRYNPDNVSSNPYLIAINLGPAESTGIGVNDVSVDGALYQRGLVELDTALGAIKPGSFESLDIKDIRLVPGQAVILRLVEARRKEEL